MKRLVNDPRADMEVTEAAQWYERHQQGLGATFLEELDAAAFHIKSNPQQYGVVGDNVRCCKLHRFPYGVFFQEEDDRVYVLAVLHLHRDSSEWIKRL